MAPSGTNSQAAPPLPLFRPEALAAQEKEHGDVLRIRPLSLAFFPWLAITVGAVVLAYLLVGHYTENVRITGFLVAGPNDAPAANEASQRRARAILVVPARWIGAFRQGTNVEVRCPGCSDPGRKLAAEVVNASPSVTDQNALTYQVLVAFPSEPSNFLPHASSPQSGTRLEAEIPLGRRPLIHWLTKQSEP
jgi:hypothetical protein